MTNQPTFSNTENTKIYNSFHGWMGETKVKVNGFNWILTTMKRHNGTIATHCHTVQDEGNGSFSFCITDLMRDNKAENFYLNVLPKGTKATEKAIREAHYKALAEFDAKNEAGELPKASEEYKIEVGQVIFTDNPRYDAENRRAIYAIEQTQWGVNYKTVYLDGSQTSHDSRIRPYSQKFGIGTYYNEGEKVSAEEVANLVIEAKRNEELAAAAEAVQKQINAEQAKAKAEYLSQFTQADRRTTTNIIKRHILKTWPSVQKVEVMTEVYSGGDSMRVKYYSPETIKELESFVDSFQEGHFNGMEDIYEYSKDKGEIILENHILQTYKYVFCDHRTAEAPKEEPKAEEVPPVLVTIVDVVKPEQPTEARASVEGHGFELVDYSERALAVFGDTKPIKEQLKQIGGRFNPYLNHNGGKKAGWIFSKKQEQQLRKLLNL